MDWPADSAAKNCRPHGWHGAQRQAFDQFTLAAQRAGREMLELEGAVGGFFHRVGPGQRARAEVRVLRQRIADLDFARASAPQHINNQETSMSITRRSALALAAAGAVFFL